MNEQSMVVKPDVERVSPRQLGPLAVPPIGLGCNFFDTAEFYGPFANEQLMDRAIAGRREDVVLATKFGVGPNGLDASPESVRRRSTDRLRSSAPTTWTSTTCTRVDSA